MAYIDDLEAYSENGTFTCRIEEDGEIVVTRDDRESEEQDENEISEREVWKFRVSTNHDLMKLLQDVAVFGVFPCPDRPPLLWIGHYIEERDGTEAFERQGYDDTGHRAISDRVFSCVLDKLTD